MWFHWTNQLLHIEEHNQQKQEDTNSTEENVDKISIWQSIDI
jgi:hypothetical protein